MLSNVAGNLDVEGIPLGDCEPSVLVADDYQPQRWMVGFSPACRMETRGS